MVIVTVPMKMDDFVGLISTWLNRGGMSSALRSGAAAASRMAAMAALRGTRQIWGGCAVG